MNFKYKGEEAFIKVELFTIAIVAGILTLLFWYLFFGGREWVQTLLN